MSPMGALLCIHRDPADLSLLEQSGYELVTATNGSDGLRLFMSRPVDAIVLDYHLGLLDGGVVAAVIKQVKPRVPIVMLTEDVELPLDALTCVDALVVKSDSPDLLLETIRSVLNASERSAGGAETQTANPAPRASDETDAPCSQEIWQSIRKGTIQFASARGLRQERTEPSSPALRILKNGTWLEAI
jgi:DNA-binding response OmpR family regulator